MSSLHGDKEVFFNRDEWILNFAKELYHKDFRRSWHGDWISGKTFEECLKEAKYNYSLLDKI